MTTIDQHGIKHTYITIHPDKKEPLSSLIDRLNYTLHKQKAAVVKFDIFGSLKEFDIFMDSLKNIHGQIDWPITWVEGNPCFDSKFSGLQIYAVSGTPVKSLFVDSKPIARSFEDNFARYCFLGNILPNIFSVPQEEQAYSVLENMEKALKQEGIDISNVVRTWFYNNNILDWYDDFNIARNRFFKERGIFDKLLPASTGAGGKNISGSALIASAIAVKAKKDGIVIQEVPSPQQCPAKEYGSSFSRAIGISTPGYRTVFISGTASIEANGKTLYAGNIDKQIEFTMKAIDSILLSRQMSHSDIMRSIAYFKHPKEALAFEKYFKKFDKPAIPALITQSDICRNDLLFEIEVDAVSKI